LAVFSEIINEQKLFDSIPYTCKNILVFACGGCINESLAYKDDVPILKGGQPFASKIEAKRISDLLTQKGYDTRIKVLDGEMPVLCIYECSSSAVDSEQFTPDVILALSCHSGVAGLEMLQAKPVIPLTNQIGYIAYTYKDIDNDRMMIKTKTTVRLLIE
jgi:hypothetical protein